MIEPRVEELYSLVQQVLRESGFEELLSRGVVLTGGSSLMQGMVELGEEIFHMPVRVGHAASTTGGLADVVRNPRYATARGPAAGRARRRCSADSLSRAGRLGSRQCSGG